MWTWVGCRSGAFSLVSLIVVFLLASPIGAADSEEREYSIFIDGRSAGSSKMTIVEKDGGAAYMNGTVDVRYRHLLVEYTLKIETQEWWKDGKLVGLRCNSVENGKRTDVLVANDNNQLRCRANNQDRMLKSETWTTSFWKLADARFHNKTIPVLEVDTGKDFNCELKFLDKQQLRVSNQLQECYHFRVTGGPGPVDLWYDRFHRLVRQELTEMGHKTIVQLVTIRR